MPATPNYLVVGIDGMLGAAIHARLSRADCRVIGTSRRGSPGTIRLDLSQPASSWKLPPYINVAFLCAGMTSVPMCREIPKLAWAVNVTGTAELARRLAANGAFVVFPSSNRVFDGSVPYQRAEAPTCPRTEYGRTKAAAEECLLALGDAAGVIRFTKILGQSTRLIKDWKASATTARVVQPFIDMKMAPISITRAVDIMLGIGLSRTAHISQASGAEDVTYETACRFAWALMGADVSLVSPIQCRDASVLVDHVPKFTTLDAHRVTSLTGLSPPSIEATLQDVLQPNGPSPRLP